jgi:hypothetical protein
MHPNVHLSYGILVRKYKNVTITLRKEQENPLKICFCFQTGDKIVIYVSTRGHWLYHPSAPLYNLRLRLRLYRSASGWYNLNAHG